MSGGAEKALWLLLVGNGLAASFFVYLALSCLIRVKEKRWCRLLALLGCWLASIMIIYIGDMVNFSFGVAAFMVILWITCEGSRMKRFTLGLMFISTVYAFNGFYDNCVGYASYCLGLDSLFDNMYLPMRLFFAFFLYLLLRVRRIGREFELSAPLWRLLLLLTLSPFGIMLALIMIRSPFYIAGGTMLADGFLFLIVELSFAALLSAMSTLEKQQKLEQENLLALQNQRYYETMEQQQFEIRRLRHDLSNHLQTLLALPGQQKDDYIREMLDNPALGQVLVWCRDSTVNAVLTAKAELMRQKEIRFYAKVDIGEELPFEKVDICAVFANALDNAAEGCGALAEPMREVCLEAGTGKGVLALHVKNTCEDTGAGPGKTEDAKGTVSQKAASSDFRGGWGHLPRTTKKDKKNHGFGLRSIQATVEKYGGNMEIGREEGYFCLFLYLPMERK